MMYDDLLDRNISTYRRQTPTLFVQVPISSPVVRRGHKDTLIPLFVRDGTPTLQMGPQRALPLPMQRDLGLRNPPVLVRVLVGRDADDPLVDFLLEGGGGGFVLHI